MYTIKKVKLTNLSRIIQVAAILYSCGKDMAKRYDLHHWDNSLIKSIAIVYYCILKKNDVYLLFEGRKAIATFQTKVKNNAMSFEKLGTIPLQHGKGIGSYCLNVIEDLANESGCERIVTEALEQGRHAIIFYQNRGYEITGKTYSIRNRSEVVLEKLL